jgi:hypothetical protein
MIVDICRYVQSWLRLATEETSLASADVFPRRVP